MRGYKAQSDHTFAPFHMCFDADFELRRNSRLVVGCNITGKKDEDSYCGVVNIDTFRNDLLLGQINDLDLADTDVGNEYLNGLKKEMIYAVAGFEFGEWEDQVLICVR